MLGWILLGIAAAAVCVVVISGIITKSRIKEQMREKNMENAVITEINKCKNVIKLEDLNTGKTMEIRGDGVDDSLRENVKIIA